MCYNNSSLKSIFLRHETNGEEEEKSTETAFRRSRLEGFRRATQESKKGTGIYPGRTCLPVGHSIESGGTY